MSVQPTSALIDAGSEAAQARGHLLRSAIKLAVRGDTGAFESLVTVLHPFVHRWSLTYARDPDEADEIVQDTFVLIHRKMSQYRGDSPVEAWAYRIARRVAFQRHRKDHRRRALSAAAFADADDVYNTDPGGRVDRQKIAEYVKRFFTELPPRQREVFDLVDLQGYDPAEAARLLNTSSNTVRGNLFKARSALRARILEDHPAWREVQA
jgi:RNA polymerase sigma-70 factor (ECF subfamily)